MIWVVEPDAKAQFADPAFVIAYVTDPVPDPPVTESGSPTPTRPDVAAATNGFWSPLATFNATSVETARKNPSDAAFTATTLQYPTAVGVTERASLEALQAAVPGSETT